MNTRLHLPGHVALVIGAGGGIGRACVEELAAAGLKVAVADARLSAAQQAVAALGTATSARAYEVDVRDAAAVFALLDRVWADLGPVDVLVNAAGLYPSDPLLSMPEDAWDRVLQTNLKGPHLCVAEFTRRLREIRSPGVAGNISSGAARRTRLGAAYYCTSKAGLDLLTHAQALELAEHHIRVNAVDPRFVRASTAPSTPCRRPTRRRLPPGSRSVALGSRLTSPRPCCSCAAPMPSG